MPSRTQHTDQAQRNDALSQSLEQDGHSEWAVAVLFYAALHWVDAYLDGGDGRVAHPTNHGQRLRYIHSTPQLRAVWQEYRDLKDQSEAARYECVAFQPADLARIRQDSFTPLQTHLRTALGI